MKKKFDWKKTVGKAFTYFIIGFMGSGVVTLIIPGMSLKEVLLVSASVGCVAGIKNVLKHKAEFDLDLTKLF